MMNKKKYILTLMVMIQALLGSGQTKNFLDQPYLETSALVDSLVVPDEIYLNITISETDTKGKTSVEELESKMESTLKNIGINTEEDLTLNDLASNFKNYFLRKQDVLKRKSYTLKVNDALMAGKAIIELEKIEISNVSLERTSFSKITQLRLELKSRAVAKARKQAEFLVMPLNQKVGAAILISDQAELYGNVLQGRAEAIQIRGYAISESDAFEPANIQFEKIRVEGRVSVKFKLED